jgi:hypothetical protein
MGFFFSLVFIFILVGWRNGVSAYGAECIPRWNWPISFRKYLETDFCFHWRLRPTCLGSTWDEPTCNFYRFTVPAFLFFYPPPLAPLPGCVQYGDLRDLILQRHWLNGERPNCRPFAHTWQPAQSVPLFQTTCQVPWTHFLNRHVSF